MILDAEHRREIERLEAAGLRRRLSSVACTDPRADFATSDVLGLARRAGVVEASRAALAEYGAGGRASRLLGGGSPVDTALEEEAAAWLGVEATLLFPSGYQANLGVLGTLVGPGDAVLSDELNHASLIDGARLSRALVVPYRHLDLEALRRALTTISVRGARRRLVVTESVFSMDGDLAPLADLADLCAEHDAWLIVDEAHAGGLLGPRGSGAWPDAGAGPRGRERLAARIVTGGKALGATGALVAGSGALVELLVNRARSFVFTTAPGPSVPAALRAAIRIVREEADLRERARAAAGRLARTLGLPPPAAVIVPLIIGDERDAMAAAEAARRAGFDVRAVRPPTVPRGTARLRLVARAAHREEDIDRLARVLRPHLPEVPPRPLAPHSARRPLFVCGTDTGVGKTVVAALLLNAARRLGSGSYWKPVETGTDDDTAVVSRLAGVPAGELPAPAYRFPLPASPHAAAAAAGASIDPEELRSTLRSCGAEAAPGRLVVELAGGLLVPLTERYTQLDWLARERPDLVLVARSGVGTLNHTLLSLEALRSRQLEPRALLLVGPPHSSNRATLERLAGVPRLLEVPTFAPLAPAGIQRWLDENDLAELVAVRR